MHIFILFFLPLFMLVALGMLFLTYGIVALWAGGFALIGLLGLLVCTTHKRATQTDLHVGYKVFSWVSLAIGLFLFAAMFMSVVWMVGIIAGL